MVQRAFSFLLRLRPELRYIESYVTGLRRLQVSGGLLDKALRRIQNFIYSTADTSALSRAGAFAALLTAAINGAAGSRDTLVKLCKLYAVLSGLPYCPRELPTLCIIGCLAALEGSSSADDISLASFAAQRMFS